MNKICKFISIGLVIGSLPSFILAQPVSVTDDRQVTSILESPPKRVAAISIFGADLMVKLQHPLVALSTRNNSYPSYLKPQLGNLIDLGAAHETNLEMLTKAQSDLTVGIKIYTLPVAKKIEEISPFLAFDFNSWADSDRAIAVTTTALGLAEKGVVLNQSFRKLAKSFSERASNRPQNTLLLWFWAGTPVGFHAEKHLTTELISVLNVENVMSKHTDQISQVLSMEKILQLDPDSILIFQGGDKKLQYHPVWERLKAYRNQRIYRVSEQYVEPHGPIAREYVLREMAHLFYPLTFPKPSHIPAKASAKFAGWKAAN